MANIILNSGHTVLVSDADYPMLCAYKWLIMKPRNGSTFYAKTFIKRKTILMHRLILGVDERKKQVDHEDGNGLNNTRENLRIATNSDNSKNRKGYGTSKYLGVSISNNHRQKIKWRASIRINGKSIFLGYHAVESDAAIAYNMMALSTGNEFYRLNRLIL